MRFACELTLFEQDKVCVSVASRRISVNLSIFCSERQE